MKKTPGVYIAIAIAIFFACNKPASRIPAEPSTDQVAQKITQWLDFQKTTVKTVKVQNIADLEKDLDFTGLAISSDSGSSLVNVPIRKTYLSEHHLDLTSTISLVAKLDGSGKVLNANIVLFTPDQNTPASLSIQTLYKVSISKPAAANGQFKILSVAGRWLSQMRYQNGKLSSIGTIMPGRYTQSDKNKIVADGCIDWYLVTTITNSDGSQDVIEEYVGTTCGCNDPMAEGLCPDGGGGGGDGDDDGCVASETSNFDEESSNGEAVSEDRGSSSSDIDGIDKNKNPSWTCFRGAGGWTLISFESGTVHLDDVANNIWSWTAFSHNSISMNGQTLPGVAVTFTQGVGTPAEVAAAGANILYEGMSLTFAVTYSFVCNCPNLPVLGQIPPITRNYTATSNFWDANPNH